MKSKLIVNILKNKNFIMFFLFGIIGFLLFFNLGEYNQPTANLWINRSYKFFYEIKTNNFDQTYVFYHPGVTLMWLVGPVVYYFPKYTMYFYNQTIDPFDAKVFFEFNKLALIPIVSTIFLTLVLDFLLIKIFLSKKIAIIFLALVASEPFFIGNARSIHVDTLQTVFIFTSFLSLLNFIKTDQKRFIATTGVFLGLAMLTKITSIIFVPFIGLLLLIHYFSLKTTKTTFIRILLIFTSISVITTATFFIVWPVMWSQPITTISKILEDGIEESGFEHNLGYDYMYFGNISNDSFITPIIHYPLQFLFRTNGFLILLLFISIVFLFKFRKNIFVTQNKILITSTLFPIYYLIMMSSSGKMIFRYLLVIYPFFHLFLSIGISLLLKTRFKLVTIILICLAISESILTSTNSLTYYNTLTGGISGSAHVVYTDQAGAGLYQISTDLNKLKDIENKSVAVFDYNSFSSFFSGDTLKLKNHNYTNNIVNTDFVIVGVQNDKKYFDTERKDYKLIKNYNYLGQTHWSLYKRIN